MSAQAHDAPVRRALVRFEHGTPRGVGLRSSGVRRHPVEASAPRGSSGGPRRSESARLQRITFRGDPARRSRVGESRHFGGAHRRPVRHWNDRVRIAVSPGIHHDLSAAAPSTCRDLSRQRQLCSRLSCCSRPPGRSDDGRGVASVGTFHSPQVPAREGVRHALEIGTYVRPGSHLVRRGSWRGAAKRGGFDWCPVELWVNRGIEDERARRQT
jgi:hypothetical protein